jgi:release factor glutamine methyltransferase
MTEQELILTYIHKCQRADLYVDPKPLTFEQQFQFENILAKRRQGQPLQYLLGECEFMGLKFLVNPSVLVPRPETELLVELAIEKLKNKPGHLRILDIGAGSGNIAISLAKFIPNAEITAMEYSPKALEVAQKNAEIHNVVPQIEFVWDDIFSAQLERYDLIISNPPYIPSFDIDDLPLDVRQEPKLALDGGEDGLRFYRHIIASAGAHLVKGGLLIMEIGDGQRQAIENILRQYPRFLFEFHKDYRETDRILVIQSL